MVANMTTTKTAYPQRMAQFVADAYCLGTAVANNDSNQGLYPLMDDSMSALQEMRRTTSGAASLETVMLYMVIYLSEAFDAGVADARGNTAPSLGSLLDKSRTLIQGYLSSAT